MTKDDLLKIDTRPGALNYVDENGNFIPPESVIFVKEETIEQQLRNTYRQAEQDTAERLAKMFEHYGYERAAADIREVAALWDKPVYQTDAILEDKDICPPNPADKSQNEDWP